MKKVTLLAFVLSFSLQTIAKEGMWIPYLIGQLNHQEMTEMGLQITAEDIYSVNNSSLKDAIVHFGGGCTAEIISSRGLLLTNHHCGYSQIQSHSSLENDYLKNGFWAKDQASELKNPNLTAAIVKYMEDVTNKVLKGINQETSDADRQKIMAENVKKITEEYNSKNAYDHEIKPFYYGNQFIIIAKETFRDVRLVGAPPSSIGKFGADTDNWMWPRHTGDFSIFRIYSGKDNLPSDVSDDNVPYVPAEFLKINIDGAKEGEFTMIYGFPGTTQEYLPSNEMRNIVETYDPLRIGIRESLLKVLDEKMRKDDATRIKYAAKYARISNAWKKWIGEIKGVRESNGIERREAFEKEFMTAVNGNLDWKARYGSILDDLKKPYDERKEVGLERYRFIESVYYGIELMRHMMGYRQMVEAQAAGDAEKVQAMGARLAKSVRNFMKNYDPELDQTNMFNQLSTYLAAVKTEPIPEYLTELKAMDQEGLAKYVSATYASNPVLKDTEKWITLLEEKPAKAAKKIMKSNAFQLATSSWEHFIKALNPAWGSNSMEIQKQQARYVNALKEVFPNKRLYPDANSTLRVAYGLVEGYHPRDGVKYHTHTYLSGVMAKYVPGDYEFDLPQRLIDLYDNKDYGRYGEGSKMPVCFIASNHTTGGNSGSPALNGRGELIGLNFDRVWEGTMSDINYDIDLCRNIMVDIRYVLFIVDKFAGASYLVDEMELVSSGDKQALN